MNTIAIISRHSNVAAAVIASGIDLSYNEALAQEHIRDADSPCRRARELGIQATEKAYVVSYGGYPVVLAVYTVNGVRTARRFSPFVSVLDDSDLQLYAIDEAAGTITDTKGRIPRSWASKPAQARVLRELFSQRPDVVSMRF